MYCQVSMILPLSLIRHYSLNADIHGYNTRHSPSLCRSLGPPDTLLIGLRPTNVRGVVGLLAYQVSLEAAKNDTNWRYTRQSSRLHKAHSRTVLMANSFLSEVLYLWNS